MWIFVVALAFLLSLTTAQKDTTATQCGSHITGNTDHQPIVSFDFNNDQLQNVIISDINNTFAPVLVIKDSSGRYIEIEQSNRCQEVHCKDTHFAINALPNGKYTFNLIPKVHSAPFIINVSCSVPSNESGIL